MLVVLVTNQYCYISDSFVRLLITIRMFALF